MVFEKARATAPGQCSVDALPKSSGTPTASMPQDLQCHYCHLPIPGVYRRAAQPEPAYCCYGCRFAADIAQAGGEKGQATWMLTRLGIAAFLSMAVMVFSFYLYGQDVYGELDAEKTALQANLTGLMRYLSLAFAAPVLVILGWPIFTNALAQLRRGVLSTDVLVMIGVAAAFVYSYISTITDRGVTYYETACMILVLLTFGRWLEASGKVQASARIEALARLIPDQVLLCRAGENRTVASGEICVGDELLVSAGQRIAADGLIVEGQAHVDEQLLTGESTPVVRSRGDSVRAGTLSLDGALTVRAAAVGRDSALGRLIELLREARQSKGHYERLADRISAVFVPVAFVLALIGAALGWHRGGVDEAIMSMLAVLLIACPCALGLATPMAIWVALGCAAEHGVLFRRGEVVERFARLRAFCFDKTGTLTTGEPRVASFVCGRSDEGHRNQVLAVAGGLAGRSLHAMSRGVTAYAAGQGIVPRPAVEVRTVGGRGVVGTVNGEVASLGNAAWMAEQSLIFDAGLRERLDSAVAEGRPVACVGWKGAVRGLFVFAESLRPEAEQALSELQRLGCHVVVLTGDHGRRGAMVETQLKVPVHAELLPEDKLTLLKQLRAERGAVAMVGDGINDAPALAAADVGVAMGCGADLARESADVCLLGNDLRGLIWATTLARRTVRTIRMNLFWAFTYNLFGISLALTGRLKPIIAAGLMVVSSLAVVNRSLRLGRQVRR